MLGFATALLLVAQAAPAAGELDFAPGALGFDAMIAGDYRSAETQLGQAQGLQRLDPAWLINYGQLLARTGRVDQAEQMLRAAVRTNDSELVLADGSLVSSKEAARDALRTLLTRRLSSR